MIDKCNIINIIQEFQFTYHLLFSNSIFSVDIMKMKIKAPSLEVPDFVKSIRYMLSIVNVIFLVSYIFWNVILVLLVGTECV